MPSESLIPDGPFEGAVEVRHVIFTAPDDGYAVLEVLDEDSGEEVIMVGPVGHLSAGDRAQVTAEWQMHKRHGPQLKATGAMPLDPVDRAGQMAYLVTLRHIGPARAERLIDVHGDRVLERIATDPAGTFSSLKGLSRAQAAEAAQSWNDTRAVRDLHIQLAPHGLAHLAARLHTRYGADAMRVLHEDPYSLTEIDGVGFRRADVIALAADVPRDSDRRAQAAAAFALVEAERQGHTNLPLPELVRRTARLLELQPDPEVLTASFGLVTEGDRVYRRATRDSELAVAETLARRGTAEATLEHKPGEEPRDGLTEEQWEAVRGAFSSRISVLTGGPGVGKTVCLRAIVAEAQSADLRIALCAPTGRAARRMEEATGHTAATIHRLLEWNMAGEPRHHAGHPLPADIVVVDEASMLNLRVAEVLLGGIAEGTHVVWVGDADQLPPVGAGKPFADLIEAGIVPVTRLTRIFRQAAQSMITTAAHEVNNGRIPHTEPEPGQVHDFFFVERRTPERTLEAVVEMVADRVSAGLGLDPVRDCQVLAPMYKTAVGIDALNTALQARLNPTGTPALNERFRLGDRLIQTRNAHELGLMNGSICFLVDDVPEEETVVLETDDGQTVIVPYDESDALRLAYAISVHKSQGCEVPVVVCVCHRSHSVLLSRPLIYTAITRAKTTCVLVGERSALELAVRRDDAGARYSSLAQRLRAAEPQGRLAA